MSETQKSLHRMQRIHHLENGKLNALVGELSQIDARITAATSKHTQLQKQKADAFSSPAKSNAMNQIDRITANGQWVERIEQAMEKTTESIRVLNAERTIAHTRLLEQRARAEGLAKRVQQIRIQWNDETNSEQWLAADEHAMNQFAGN